MMELKKIVSSGKFLRLSEEAQRLYLFMVAFNETNGCDITFVMRLSGSDEGAYLELYEKGFVKKNPGGFVIISDFN